MRRSRMITVAVAAAGMLALDLALPRPAIAQPPQDPDQASVQQEFQPFTPEQLDNLVAPVALYADPLLAQVLLAATFPDEIAEAAKYVRTNGTDGIDEEPWDVSVKAVAHYPTVLNMMDTKADWTTSLGQAYAGQSTEVMQAIQRMRRMAQAQGNLVSSSEQEVLADDGYVRIWPANPRYIYVPVYDPAVVFVRPVFVRPGFHAFFSFGLPFRIGPWLIYDWDWPAWRIYYTGWAGGGWIARSRPFVSITNVYYVNPMHRRVWYGRDVLRRHPDYGRIRRYDALHPGLRYPGDDGMRGRNPRTGDPNPPSRRAIPRDNAGSRPGLTPPRPVPMQTQPSAGAPVRVPGENRPAIERPRPAPVETRPAVEVPRSAPVERQPSVDPPRSAPVERQPSVEVPRWTPPQRQPAIERPRPAPVETRPSPDVPRWTPPERQPAVERPRPVPEYRPPVVERPRVESRPAVQQPRVEQPRVEQRPAVQQPRVEQRPAGQQPRAEQRPQVQRSGGERGGEPRQAQPREHH